MPCEMVDKFKSFGTTCLFHHQDQLQNMTQHVHVKLHYPPTRRQNPWMLRDKLKFYTGELLWGILYDEESVTTKLLKKYRQHIHSLQSNVTITATCFGLITFISRLNVLSYTKLRG
jgi:hypothetical protein